MQVLQRCSVAVPKQPMKKSKLNPICIYMYIYNIYKYRSNFWQENTLFTNCNAATVQHMRSFFDYVPTERDHTAWSIVRLLTETCFRRTGGMLHRTQTRSLSAIEACSIAVKAKAMGRPQSYLTVRWKHPCFTSYFTQQRPWRRRSSSTSESTCFRRTSATVFCFEYSRSCSSTRRKRL